ncbi:MAG: MtrB/PioB family decaheme-associated outer membrane protein [Gammaproteobacteria bacterium]|nr:MtrB/PioB family decaheme-associated outer membrane protein [Gammaproteobacteria bacterium]NIQ12206.1 MtrB/PioB family decaheme-associated outer membrane protein [Gammaproteobacteria bacterium]NIQ75044.1 MtrB/PioB family decaheme-associated outer membrane protein [Gammaproteobacteria bacterium]NIR26077.1 MtrB/PioB family decaheme-associated outer membrane protein [Gammaproteobacteria bacterium]NIR95902.1 MtrB/PioB family decaheme-associated outer membrane protein [Gammaproteobacteria bacteri
MLEEDAEAPPPVYYNNVELGLIYNSEDSFKFGEYTGIVDEGFYADFNFNVDLLTPYDDDSTRYMEFYGTDVGLDSRSVYGEYGQQGRYSAYIDYDQIPHFRLDDARTAFVGAGTNNQTLPAGWVFGDDPVDNTTLQADARQVDVETQRYKAGGGFTWIPLENWQVRGNYHHEIKEGTETLGSIFGTNGGNMEASILIVPIDFETNEFDTGVAYTTEKYQLDLSYHFSGFNNRDNSVRWRNPSTCPGFGAVPGGCGAFPNDPGLIETTGPDNTAHQVTLSGGYNLGLTSRLSGSFSWGQMLQDDNFSAYTVNPRYLPLATPLPRSNLDGKIQTIFANLNYTVRPLSRLSVRAHYTYDDRDNKSPRDVYSRVSNDSTPQADPANAGSPNNRLPLPYSLERHHVEVDGDYRLTRMAKLGAGYEFLREGREEFSEVDTTNEHTGKVKLSMTPFSMTSGWVEYAYSKRDGDEYVSNQPFLDGHPPAHIANVGIDGTYENNPFLRKWYMADRNKHEVRGTVNYTPYNRMSLGLTGGYDTSNYDNTVVGLRDTSRLHSTLDVGINPTEDVDTYAFLTYERLTHDQVGYDRGTAAIVPGDILNPDDFWSLDAEDQVYTLGTGINVRNIMGGKIDITADYTFSFADTKTDQDAGANNQPVSELPHLKTKIHSFKITGDYRLRGNMKLRASYLFEYFRTRDYALDDVTLDTIPDVILLGNSSPNYTAHVFGASFIYEF